MGEPGNQVLSLIWGTGDARQIQSQSTAARLPQEEVVEKIEEVELQTLWKIKDYEQLLWQRPTKQHLIDVEVKVTRNLTSVSAKNTDNLEGLLKKIFNEKCSSLEQDVKEL